MRWTSAAVLCLASVGCTMEHDVSLTIGLDTDIRGGASAFELQVVAGASCPDAGAVLARAAGPVHAQSWRTGDAPASVGRLPPGDWSFAVVVRDAGCAPIAFACESITVGRDERVVLRPARLAWTDAVCPGGVCERGLCGSGVPPACEMDCAAIGATCCGGSCVSLQANHDNCGACGRACGAGQTCSDGACVECPRGGEGLPGCDCVADPSACTCDTGTCAGTCCGGLCTDTSSEAAHCGSCGHVCPEGLGCTSGLCRPVVGTEAVTVSVSGGVAGCGLLAAVVWVPIGSDPATPEGRPIVAISVPVDSDTTTTIPFDREGPPADLCAGVGCFEGLGFAEIAIAGDQNGDGSLQVDPELTRPTGGFAVLPIALVWSDRERAPSDPELARLNDTWGIHLIEGTLAGLAAYRADPSDPAGLRLIPDPGGDRIDPVELCRSADCAEPVDEACYASQPRPFGQRFY